MTQQSIDHAVAVLREVADDLETGRIVLQEWGQRLVPQGMVTVAYARYPTGQYLPGRPCRCATKPVRTTDSSSAAEEYQCPECGAAWTEPFEE